MSKKQKHRPRHSVSNPNTRWGVLLFLALLALYLSLFLTTPLRSLPRDPRTGEHPVRLVILLELLNPAYTTGKWFGDDPASVSLLDRVGLTGVAAAIFAMAYVTGRLLLELVGADRGLTRLEVLVFSLGVGLNVLSLATLAVGLAGWLHCPLALAVPMAMVLAIAGRRWMWKWIAPQVKDPADSPQDTNDGLGRRWLWLGAPFVAIILLGGMLPPWDFDVREYHLQVPKEWYQQGKITFLPHNVYGNMPLGAEMHALLAMVLLQGERAWWWGALAGKTVIAALMPLTALALLAAGRRFFSITAGVVAALVYVSIPWMAKVSMAGLIEGAVAFYLLLAVYAVMLWSSRRSNAKAVDDGHPSRHGLLLLAGFLAGGAAACKYPALLLVPVPLAAWILFVERRWNWKPAGIFLLAVILGCGLWFGKNAVLAGNPTYPLLGEVFPSKTRTAALNRQWRAAHRVPRDEHGSRYGPRPLVRMLVTILWQSEWLSPLLVPLAGLAFCLPRHRRAALALAALLAYIVLVCWLLTHRIDRFWIPALPLAALLAGVGAAWNSTRLWQRILVVILACGLGGNFLLIASPILSDNRYFVALDRLRTDPERVNPVHRYLNKTVANGRRVLLVGDAQPFDLEVPALYSTCFDPSPFERWMKDRSPQERRAALAKNNISHVYVHWGEIARYRSPGNYGFTDYVTQEVFDELVSQGILERIEGKFPQHPGELYRVVESSQR